MKWLPALGWRSIGVQETLELGFDVRWRWQLLEFEWLCFGFAFFARPRGQRFDWPTGSAR